MKEIIKSILELIGLLVHIKRILKFELKKEYPIIINSYNNFISPNRFL